MKTFVEVGPGKVLSGLMRQINREANCLNVEDSASLEAARAKLECLSERSKKTDRGANEMPDQEIENKVKQIIVDELEWTKTK